MTFLSIQDLAHRLVCRFHNLSKLLLKLLLQLCPCNIQFIHECERYYFLTDTCDFEDQNVCGYTQDKTDDFDWVKDNGGTTTRGTGPSVDHTYGTKDGNMSSPHIWCFIKQVYNNHRLIGWI